MKKFTLLFLFMSAFTQAQRFDWVTRAGYTFTANSVQAAVAIARDSQGNIYTLNSANGQQICQGITADPFSGITTTFLYKFNAAGVLQYIKTIGLNPMNIQIGENDNLYLLGSLMGTNSLKIGTETFVGTANRNYIIKFDPTGVLLWTAFNNVSGPLSQSPMLQFANNHIYFQSSNLSISKLNTNGQYVATLTANTFVSNDSSSGVSFKGSGVLSNGDLVFAAISRGTITYGTTTLSSVLETGTYPLLLLRTNENLVFSWGNYFNGLGNPQENSMPLAIGNDDGIYLGVMVNSTITAGTDSITNPGPGSTNYTDGILKVNNAGNGVWIKSVTTNTFALAMLNNPDGSGVFCGGKILGFQPINLGTTTLNPANGNSFITKIDYNGVFQNSFAFASGPGSYAKSLATNNQGVFYVGGIADSTLPTTFSCVSREGRAGLYLAKFTEQPDRAPTPSITVSGNTLTATPDFSGTIQWFLNGAEIQNATNQTFTVTQTGNYTVKYNLSDYISCFSTSAVTTISNLGSVDFESVNNAIKVYPNPTAGKVTISSLENAIIDKIEIVDVLGKTVSVKTGNPSQINISEITNGVYVLKIYSGENVFVKKIIKN